MKCIQTWIVGGFLLACSTGLEAHVASNAFLRVAVQGGQLDGTLELAVRDAEIAIGLDANRDGRVTWGEVREASADLARYLAAHIRFGMPEGRCTLYPGAVRVNARLDGNYLWIPFTAACPGNGSSLQIEYSVLHDEDPSHRGLLTLQSSGEVRTAVLGGDGGVQGFALAGSSHWRGLVDYLQAGIVHIWGGFDHLLFLISLLLPAVLIRRDGRWEAVPFALPAFRNILTVVTAFTLAHSVTLTLAALELVRLPTRLTESIIAASIVVGALNNVFPVVTEARWRIAFAFGLLHGFGFAAVLGEMGLPAGTRLLSLAAFNLGVETGQLAVVVAIMPLAYLIRRSRFYQRAVLPWGSALISGLALVWCVQRALG